MHWWRAAWAMSSLTVCEITRQKSWVILIVVMAVMLSALASLQAVDEASQIKLAVSTISGSINFISTLFAILLAAACITRDREQLVSLTLFPKPLPMSAYVCGRWIGVQIALACAIISLNALGSLVVMFTSNQHVGDMQSVRMADTWETVDAFGQDPQLIDKTRCSLTGSIRGLSLRWHMSELPSGDLRLLIKGRLRAVDPAHVQSRIRVSAKADERSEEHLLQLAASTPYGAHLPDGQRVKAGEAMIKDKGYNHQDLNQDYLHFVLPRSAVSADGSSIISLTREDVKSNLTFEREQSCLVAVSGGSFFTNMQRGGFIVLAQVGYLNAIALLCACFSNIGVTLLTGLTAFFAALMLSYVQEMTPAEKTPHFVLRFLDVLELVIPDFNYFGVEAVLAGGRAVTWHMVYDAWVYYSAYSIGFIVVAWFVMRRREL